MTNNFKSIAHDALAIDAAEIMEKNKIFTLVVTQTKDNASGIITMHQLLESGIIQIAMISNLKFFSCFLISLSAIASLSAKEIPNYGDISIKAEHVTLNKFTNKLILKTNIQINFGDFILSGDSAILSYDEEKLVIDGSPASILSNKNNINGVANQFIIYPNLSMEMLGDARLQQKDQSIYAEQITYQISLR